MRNFVLMVGALALGFVAAHQLTVTWAAHAAVVTEPFTSTMRIVDLTGAQPNVFTRKVRARKSDGTTVEWSTKKAGTLRRIEALNGKKVIVSDLTNSKVVQPTSAMDTAQLKKRLTSPPVNCKLLASMKHKGFTTIKGQKVSILESLASHNRKVTSYMAPELGCELLGYTVKRDGKVLTRGELLTFERGEPAQTLFDEGIGYKAQKASELIAEQLVKMGAPAELTKEQVKELDGE